MTTGVAAERLRTRTLGALELIDRVRLRPAAERPDGPAAAMAAWDRCAGRRLTMRDLLRDGFDVAALIRDGVLVPEEPWRRSPRS